MEKAIKLKILLVDDEREEREGIEYLIQKYNYPLEAAQATNGVKALEYMEKHPVDILFSDVKMPMMDGLELAKIVNKRYPDTKIIIFSAYGEFSYAKQALEANAVNYLLKPIELDEFQNVMEDLLKSIEETREQKEKQRIQNYQNHQNVLYKLLTGAAIRAEEKEWAFQALFFPCRKLRLLHIEFSDNVFEQKEEAFLNLIQMYLGTETEYMNLFPNEAGILLYGKKYMDRDYLEGQLLKLSRDMTAFISEGMTITVGKPAENMEELEAEVQNIRSIERELLGFGEMIVWTEKAREAKYFSSDTEMIRKQLMMAVEANQPELIERLVRKLKEEIAANNMVSKIYVQNMFFTVIQAMYDKNPDIRFEKIINGTDAVFHARNAREMLSLFEKNIEEMLEVLKHKTENDSNIIQKIKNMAEKEYMHDLSLNDVAQAVNLAPAYVSYIFKKETGKTLIKYITEIKMEKARMLLDEGNLKINQIAKICGYENQSYFNRTFKNYYDLTPRQYKERERRQPAAQDVKA